MIDLDDGRVVVDICRYDRLFDIDRNGPFRDSLPQLERWTVDPARRQVTRDVIDERFQEFPRVAGSVSTTHGHAIFRAYSVMKA